MSKDRHAIARHNRDIARITLMLHGQGAKPEMIAKIVDRGVDYVEAVEAMYKLDDDNEVCWRDTHSPVLPSLWGGV